MPVGKYESVTFTSSKKDTFHLSIFSADTPTSGNASADAPPVLFCVHGAGMSGDNFNRLAAYLQSERKLSEAMDPGLSGAETPTMATRPGGNSPLPPPPHAQPGGCGNDTSRPPMFAAASGAFAFAPPPSGADGASGEETTTIHVVTFDLRCHGLSTFAGGEDNLTLPVMVEDFREILMYAKDTLFPHSDFYVLGHSLGGSIVAHGLQDKPCQARIAGVVLVDVVEGTAKLSLKYMHDFLKKRPVEFNSVVEAETWFLRHGGMRSADGAAVSVPPLLKEDPASGKFVWRSNLNKMESVWDGWFDGLDTAFVSLPFPKMLCLANAERLDTQLTVAQMQGKFQFEIIGHDCGHYVMDDATAVLGSKIVRFVRRIETLTRRLKVGMRPDVPLHMNNTTIPPSRMEGRGSM